MKSILLLAFLCQTETVTIEAVREIRSWDGLLGERGSTIRVAFGPVLTDGAFSAEAVELAKFDGILTDERVPKALPQRAGKAVLLGYGGDRKALAASVAAADGPAVVLARIPADEAVALCREMPRIALCLIPAPFCDFRVGDSWIVSVPAGGDVAARVTLGRETGVETVRLAPSGKEGPLRRKHGGVRFFEEPAPVPAQEPELPERLEADRPAAVFRKRSNRAAELRIHSVTLRGDGVHVDLEWTNIIPLTAVYDRNLPTEYRIPNLADHLYLVLNGSRLARIVAEPDEIPGHLPVRDFRLERIGSRLRGVVAFGLSAAPETLELRFYDYAHGHLSAPLLRGKPSARKPPVAGANEVVDAGIAAVRKRKAAEGVMAVEVEFLATSRFVRETDAGAYDPKAKKGQKIQLGTVCDWKEARKHAHLVVDGEYAYRAEDSSTLEAEPRFLPDVPTGGTLVFLVPEKFASMEFRGDFPNASTPDGEVIHPKPLVLALEGSRPAPPKRETIAKVDDDCFHLAVVGQAVTKKFAGEETGEEANYLVLDVVVRNSGGKGEWFQTVEQLRYAAEDGGQLPVQDVTFKGPRRPYEHVWIPAGETRAFQVVFEIPASETKPRLAYAGVSKAETLTLRPISGKEKPKARACPKCKEPAAGDDEYCQICGAKIGK